MVELSEFEQETLAWGSRYVKKPWAEMVEKMGRIGAGEKLTKQERTVDLELAPWIKIDLQSVLKITTTYLYQFLKIPNATMFTIIMGEKGDRIIWASIEYEKNGIYKQFVPLKDRVDEEWATEAAKFIVENRLNDLFTYLKEWITKQPALKHMELGLIKIAGIQFFDEFRKAYEISNKGTDVGTLLAYMIGAFKNVFENNWIHFEPEPYGINVIRKLFLEKLKLNPELMKNAIVPMLPELNIGIALLSQDWGTMVKMQLKEEALTLEMDQDKSDVAFNAIEPYKTLKTFKPLKTYTDKVRKKFKANVAVGLDATKVINLLLKIVKTPSPWDWTKIDQWMGDILPGVKEYKNYWYYSPELVFMKGWAKWFLRRFGYNIELERFSDWWVSELFIFAILNALGMQFKLAMFLLNKEDKLETALMIEGDEGHLQKISTFPESTMKTLKEIFASEPDHTEAVGQAKFALWKEYGWIKYGVGIKLPVVQELLKRVMKLSGFILALPFRVLFFYYFLKKVLGKELYMAPRIPLEKVLKDIGLRDLMKVGKAAIAVLFDEPEVEYPNLEKAGLT